MMRVLNRFPHAIRGITKALRTDFSFKTQFWGGALFIPVFSYLVWPLTNIEIFFLGLAYMNVLVTELQNSAFEAALNRLHPERNEDIGKSKDMAAGAVLISGLFALFVVVSILLSRFM